MRRFVLAALAAMLPAALLADDNPQMRLSDPLDYPLQGYCIDILSVRPTARADLPLVVRNCLPNLPRVDRQAIERGGRIEMPAFNACVTAFGVIEPLPGAAVILRPCGSRESFLNAGDLQRFERTAKNQFQLRGTDLCLTAGADAARTFSASDRWRTLTMERCNEAPRALSVWAE